MNRPTEAEIAAKSARNKAAWNGHVTDGLVLATAALEGVLPAKPAPSFVGVDLGSGDRTVIALSVPYPPTVNTYWRHFIDEKTRAPKSLLSKRAKEYRKRVLAAVGPCMPLRGRLRVLVELSPPDGRTRDLDNIPKALFDSLQHACVYADDSQIDEFTVRRMPVVVGGACRVTIWEDPKQI